MQVVFSCMDYKDPTKPFYFFVKVNEDRSYSGGSIISKLMNTLESRQVPSIGCNELPPVTVVSVLCLPRRFHTPQTYHLNVHGMKILILTDIVLPFQRVALGDVFLKGQSRGKLMFRV